MDIRIRVKAKKLSLPVKEEKLCLKKISYNLLTAALSLACMAIQLGGLDMDISPILVF